MKDQVSHCQLQCLLLQLLLAPLPCSCTCGVCGRHGVIVVLSTTGRPARGPGRSPSQGACHAKAGREGGAVVGHVNHVMRGCAAGSGLGLKVDFTVFCVMRGCRGGS